ncbi:hypothetical protein MPSEU_000976500 [Mayamaea pseudoterrestris]|nr:hypothetical protein MPSEU_000976500 [Mayamaea pseudoterrestris]
MMLDLAMGNDASAYTWVSDSSASASSSSSHYDDYKSHTSSPRQRGSNRFARTKSHQTPAISLSTQFAIDSQYKSQLASFKDFQIKLRNTKTAIETMKKTGEALEHELQVINELEEGAEPVEARPKNRALVDKWLHHRQDALRRRMEYLQQYIQGFSKQQVLDRWGEGPHQVAFTVEYKNDAGDMNNRQLIIELASVHDMPHSVHFFLEMVELGIWDHTVLLHHENIEHLIAAVPIDFRQQQFKHSHLATLGWTKLGFPEYHSSCKHDKYSLGFANSGPTWYFNTVQNSLSHGPNGQAAKKLFDEDADPCFAQVVQGHGVMDDLIEFGLHQHQVEFEQGHPWADEPHTWTHLIKAELLHVKKTK